MLPLEREMELDKFVRRSFMVIVTSSVSISAIPSRLLFFEIDIELS